MPNKSNIIEQAKMQAKPFDKVLEKIMEICPACVQNGKIDFERLRNELADHVDDSTREFYEFTWTGKKKAIVEANTPINKTLRPCKEESLDWDTTENLYIEGDNLEVLKLLQESYLNKIKMIYIDPPYNTGNDFVYKDDFKQSREEYAEELGIEDEEGNKLFKNTESNGRFHSDWCSMIYPRLKLARDLLKDDGVIFISIDDNEQANLTKICNEIFGEENFVACFIVTSAPAGTQSSINVSNQQSYCLCYAKQIALLKFLIKRTNEELNQRYTDFDSKGRFYSERLWKRGIGGKKEDVPSLHFSVFYNPSTNDILIDTEEGNKDGYIEIIPYHTAGVLGRWTWSRDSMITKKENLLVKMVAGEWKLHKKVYEAEETGKLPFSIIGADIGRTEIGSLEVKNLFDGKKLFDYPKASNFIKHFISFLNLKDSIILDFFSGSATTAHAVIQLNAEDNGNRKFICVQLPEETDEKSEAYKAGYKNICEIGKERIRRAGAKIKEEMLANNKGNGKEMLKQVQHDGSSLLDGASLLHDGKGGHDSEGDHSRHPELVSGSRLDTGFRVLKLDSSNMKDVFYNAGEMKQNNLLDSVENIKEDRTSLDLLYGIMLDWGIILDLPIQEKNVGSNTYYLVGNNDLVACFDKNINTNTIEAMAKENAIRAVFRDSSFNDRDDAKINMQEIFKAICKWDDKTVKGNIKVI